jgi:hypothetical protein
VLIVLWFCVFPPCCQWIESYAMHFHLSPSVAAELTPLLRAGDDAKDVKWLLASEDNPEMQKLYGSHRPILQMAVRKWKESNKAEK